MKKVDRRYTHTSMSECVETKYTYASSKRPGDQIATTVSTRSGRIPYVRIQTEMTFRFSRTNFGFRHRNLEDSSGEKNNVSGQAAGVRIQSSTPNSQACTGREVNCSLEVADSYRRTRESRVLTTNTTPPWGEGLQGSLTSEHCDAFFSHFFLSLVIFLGNKQAIVHLWG